MIKVTFKTPQTFIQYKSKVTALFVHCNKCYPIDNIYFLICYNESENSTIKTSSIKSIEHLKPSDL